VQFFEKKRKKAYFFGRAEEDVCWEQWTLDVTLAQPRTETGVLPVQDVVGELYTDCRNRCPQSAPRHDQVTGESCTQNHFHCEPRQRPHPTHYHNRREPVPLPDRREPKDRCGERLATTHWPLLGTRHAAQYGHGLDICIYIHARLDHEEDVQHSWK
jgi:hypothetical protein